MRMTAFISMLLMACPEKKEQNEPGIYVAPGSKYKKLSYDIARYEDEYVVCAILNGRKMACESKEKNETR